MGKKRVIEKSSEERAGSTDSTTSTSFRPEGEARSKGAAGQARVSTELSRTSSLQASSFATTQDKSGRVSSPQEEKEQVSSKKEETKSGQKVSRGIAFIQATYNNTLITIADAQGNTICWSSAGSLGFSGAKKATPYAAARVAEVAVEKSRRSGIQDIVVRVSGVGSGRDSAIRSLANHGLTIVGIKDVTPLPHNGPRPKKVRRV